MGLNDDLQTLASQLQISASRHKWAMVYDRQNQTVRTGLQPGMPAHLGAVSTPQCLQILLR